MVYFDDGLGSAKGKDDARAAGDLHVVKETLVQAAFVAHPG